MEFWQLVIIIVCLHGHLRSVTGSETLVKHTSCVLDILCVCWRSTVGCKMSRWNDNYVSRSCASELIAALSEKREVRADLAHRLEDQQAQLDHLEDWDELKIVCS